MKIEREEKILLLKEIARSIADNAESIVGSEKYDDYLSVSFKIPSFLDELPEVVVEKGFFSEKTIERLGKMY